MEPTEGFYTPVRQSGIKPMWMMGVPRNLMIFNGVVAFLLVIVWKVWQLAFVPLVLHAVFYYLYNRVDMEFFEVLRRYLKIPDHMEP